MSKLGAAAIAAVAFLLFPAIAHAQNLEEQRKLCNSTLSMPAEAVIGACTALIRAQATSTENRAAAYVNRGVAQAKLRNYRAAIDDYTAAIALDPRDATAYEDRGVDRLRARDYAGSLDDLNRYAELHFPPAPEVVHDIALDYFNLGRSDEALRAATTSINGRAGNSSALLLRADIMRRMKMTDLAFLDTEHVAAIPDYWAKSTGELRDRAYARGFIGDYTGALGDLRAVLQREPRNVDALASRCFVFAVLDRYAQALHDCNFALSIQPNDESTLQSRGFAYLRMRRYSDALRDLRAAAALDASDPDALYVLGVAEKLTGNATGAAAHIARAKQFGSDIGAFYTRAGLDPDGRVSTVPADPVAFNVRFPRRRVPWQSIASWDVDARAQFDITSVELSSYAGRLYVDKHTEWRNEPIEDVWYEVPFTTLKCAAPDASSHTVTLVASNAAGVVGSFPMGESFATRSVSLESWGSTADLMRVLRKKLPGVHLCR